MLKYTFDLACTYMCTRERRNIPYHTHTHTTGRQHMRAPHPRLCTRACLQPWDIMSCPVLYTALLYTEWYIHNSASLYDYTTLRDHTVRAWFTRQPLTPLYMLTRMLGMRMRHLICMSADVADSRITRYMVRRQPAKRWRTQTNKVAGTLTPTIVPRLLVVHSESIFCMYVCTPGWANKTCQLKRWKHNPCRLLHFWQYLMQIIILLWWNVPWVKSMCCRLKGYVHYVSKKVKMLNARDMF